MPWTGYLKKGWTCFYYSQFPLRISPICGVQLTAFHSGGNHEAHPLDFVDLDGCPAGSLHADRDGLAQLAAADGDAVLGDYQLALEFGLVFLFIFRFSGFGFFGHFVPD